MNLTEKQLYGYKFRETEIKNLSVETSESLYNRTRIGNTNSNLDLQGLLNFEIMLNSIYSLKFNLSDKFIREGWNIVSFNMNNIKYSIPYYLNMETKANGMIEPKFIFIVPNAIGLNPNAIGFATQIDINMQVNNAGNILLASICPPLVPIPILAFNNLIVETNPTIVGNVADYIKMMIRTNNLANLGSPFILFDAGGLYERK